MPTTSTSSLPGMLFLQIPTWLIPSLILGLCSNTVSSVSPILISLFKPAAFLPLMFPVPHYIAHTTWLTYFFCCCYYHHLSLSPGLQSPQGQGPFLYHEESQTSEQYLAHSRNLIICQTNEKTVWSNFMYHVSIS